MANKRKGFDKYENRNVPDLKVGQYDDGNW